MDSVLKNILILKFIRKQKNYNKKRIIKELKRFSFFKLI